MVTPIAYWIGNFKIFDFEKIEQKYVSGGRTKTHNNDKYVRKWWEVENYKRWQPYANGGEFRKWYGNNFDVVDWSQEATELYASKGGLYNKKICWKVRYMLEFDNICKKWI